ncbi:MAG TPA: FABP family protein [Frankiaceae bacterium]|jgi:hypothetical protein|nr:FABP family protein [Frankiaceae bacterium]
MDDSNAPHGDLAPLAFLIGTWRGEGVGGYPTMEDFRYGEEVTFAHNGKPFLSYTQRTWALDDGRPLHSETGYWRPQPGNRVEVVLAHPTGVVEVYYGDVAFSRIELATDLVARTTSAKEVTALKRLYGLVDGKLMYAVDMAAVGHDLQSHLSAVLEKVAD